MEISSGSVHGGGHAVFLMFWGLGATIGGVLILLDFRHIKKWSLSDTLSSGKTAGRQPSWRGLPGSRTRTALVIVARLIGGLVFTIVGPIVLLNGLREALRPGYAFHPFAPSWSAPLPAVLITCGIASVKLWGDWRHYRRLRDTPDAPGRAAIVADVIGLAVGAAGIATGFLIPTLAGLLIFASAQMASANTEYGGQPE